jgi:hypothetical protein
MYMQQVYLYQAASPVPAQDSRRFSGVIFVSLTRLAGGRLLCESQSNIYLNILEPQVSGRDQEKRGT